VNAWETLAHAPLFAQPPLAIAVDVVVYACVLLIAFAVIADFRSYYRQDRDVVRSERSRVETGSMTAFFVVYYLVVRFQLLALPVGGTTRLLMVVTGLVLMVAGAVMNVLGRVYLKSNWANQIKIYEGHWLVTEGPFAVVRHPLYASLIWMFLGGALVYASVAALVLTLAVFVPMMYARAKKEDALLEEAFAEKFVAYRRRTGMLFPRPPR
jgi:protein-S-isoprenylcysteine O-methyltransferase Ste14